MVFQINLSGEARKDLRKLDSNARRQILRKFEEIRELDELHLHKTTRTGEYYIRVGDYRIFFDINTNK